MKSLLLLGVLVTSAACGPLIDTEWKEYGRISSPKRGHDAVLIWSDSGAVSSRAYHVALVPHDQEWTKENFVLTFDKAEESDLEAKWSDERTLSLHLKRGRSFDQDGRTVKAVNQAGDVTVNYRNDEETE